MHSFEVHSNKSACRKSGSLGLEQVKYSTILRGYNKWYICQIDLKKETTNPDEMEIKYEIVLNVMNWAAADDIEYNNIGAFQTSDINTLV